MLLSELLTSPPAKEIPEEGLDLINLLFFVGCVLVLALALWVWAMSVMPPKRKPKKD